MQLTGIELVTASGPCETQAEARVIGRAIIADVHGKGAPIWPTMAMFGLGVKMFS